MALAYSGALRWIWGFSKR